MTTNAKLRGQGKVRPATNRIFTSLIAFLAFFFIVNSSFAQSSSAQTTIQLGAAVGAGTQVTVENLLTGGEVNGNATMEAYLLGEDAVFFSVNGLEASIEQDEVIALVHVVDGGQTRTFIIQGGGGDGGYIIGIEDL